MPAMHEICMAKDSRQYSEGKVIARVKGPPAQMRINEVEKAVSNLAS